MSPRWWPPCSTPARPAPARSALREETLVAPHLLDVEAASVLRRLDLSSALPG
jgi:hypothetical protein